MKKILLITLTILFSAICFPGKSQTLLQTFTEPSSHYSETFFGRSVAIAGDINNDGFDDMVVGADNFDGLRGCVHIFFGGENADSISDIILIGETAESYFGNDVSGAGDVNNDGYDDIIVGAYMESIGKGAAYIYYGGDPMNTIPDVVITGNTSFENTGYSVASAGDINKDGYDDVIVGEQSGYYATFGFGKAELFFGGSPMDNGADITFYGQCNLELFGSSVSYAGDVNGDGFGDIIIGSPGDGTFKPKAYIFLGGENMDRFADVILDGPECIKGYACSLSSAGDVNHDGFDDVVVGSYTTYSNVKGKAYIYLGGENMDNVPDVELISPILESTFGYEVAGGADLDLDGYSDVVIGCNYYFNGDGLAYVYKGSATMDNNADMIIQGGKGYEDFGVSVSMNGDINNDGCNDILSGSISYNLGGAAFLYLGGIPCDSISDLKLKDEPCGNGSGNIVSSAGDVNGDGFDDMISRSRSYNNKGRVYLYLGGTSIDNQTDLVFDATGTDYNSFGKSISSAGDCNNDSYDDIIIGASEASYLYYGGSLMDNQPDVIISGEYDKIVSSAGDFNNDGYEDVIIGMTERFGYNGKCYIYLGGSSMDNTADITLSGEISSWGLGRSVTSGDINNDGYDDVIVGAALGLTENRVHRIYIYFGGIDPDGVADVILSSDNITSEFGFSIDALDFNSDGYCDVLAGAYNDEDGKGIAYLYFGDATMDSVADLIFEGAGTDVNFGRSLSAAGDLNKDSIDDIIIGAYDQDWYSGNAFIYYGGELPDTKADFELKVEGRISGFGFSVSSSGDMNNDGYDEIVIGAPGRLVNGMVYLFDFHTPKKNQSVTFGDLSPVTYGTSAFALSGESTSGLPVKYTSSNLNVAGVSWNTVTVLNAGTTVIKAFQPGNMELDSSQSVSRTLVVNKANLNVTADDTSKVAGSDNPQFSISYEGFVYYDNENNLDVIPVVVTDATNVSPVGSYVLSPLGGSDNNYNFNYINGTLIVKELTSIDSPEKSSVVFFPNPAGDFIEIHIDTIDDQVVIYNAMGDIVIQKKTTGDHVDVSALDAGVYFLKLRNEVYKFVKK